MNSDPKIQLFFQNPDLVALENAATAEGDGYNQRGGLKNKSKLPKNLRLCDLDEKYVVAAGPTHMIVYNRPEQRMVHCVRVTSPVLQVQLGTVRNVMSDGHSSRGNVSRMSLKGIENQNLIIFSNFVWELFKG